MSPKVVANTVLSKEQNPESEKEKPMISVGVMIFLGIVAYTLFSIPLSVLIRLIEIRLQKRRDKQEEEQKEKNRYADFGPQANRSSQHNMSTREMITKYIAKSRGSEHMGDAAEADKKETTAVGYAKAKVTLDFTAQERVWILHALGQWQPRSTLGRILCLNSWPLHQIRLMMTIPIAIRNTTFLPDERVYFERRACIPDKEQFAPVIQKFMVWRRSLLIVFLGACGALLTIQMIIDVPKIADRLLESHKAERTHNEVGQNGSTKVLTEVHDPRRQQGSTTRRSSYYTTPAPMMIFMTLCSGVGTSHLL